MLYAQLIGHHLAISENNGKKVIKIVRDAAGQASNSLHLLRLSKPFTQLTPFGDFLEIQGKSFLRCIGAQLEPGIQVGEELLRVNRSLLDESLRNLITEEAVGKFRKSAPEVSAHRIGIAEQSRTGSLVRVRN